MSTMSYWATDSAWIFEAANCDRIIISIFCGALNGLLGVEVEILVAEVPVEIGGGNGELSKINIQQQR